MDNGDAEMVMETNEVSNQVPVNVVVEEPIEDNAESSSSSGSVVAPVVSVAATPGVATISTEVVRKSRAIGLSSAKIT